MNRNLSIYLTQDQKRFIERLIDIHLDNNKTNPYYYSIEDTFKVISHKLDYPKSIYLSRFEKELLFNLVRRSIGTGVALTLLPSIRPFTDKLMKKFKYEK